MNTGSKKSTDNWRVSQRRFKMRLLARSLRYECLEERRLLATVFDASFLSKGYLSTGSTLLSITFDEPVVGANVLSNYELRRAGTDGQLLTNDPVVNPSSINVIGNTAYLWLSSSLAKDVYRLTVKDSVTTLSGVPLDGNQDGVAGGDWNRDFLVNDDNIVFDPTFDQDGKKSWVNSTGSNSAGKILPLADGKLLVAGMTQSSTVNNIVVTRLNVDGSFDATFDGDGQRVIDVGRFGQLTEINVLPDGKLWITESNQDFTDLIRFWRLNSDGTTDTTFGNQGALIPSFSPTLSSIQDVEIVDGKILFASYSRSNVDLVRMTVNGTLDSTFGVGGRRTIDIGANYEVIRSIRIQTDGKILIAGETGRLRVVTFSSRGSPHPVLLILHLEREE